MHSTRNIHPFDTAGRGMPLNPAVLLALLLLSASFAAASLSPAAAQSAAPAQQATAVSPDVIKQREEELEATREQQRKAAELQQKLKADIAAIGQDRSKLNQQLIDIATQVRTVETRIGETEASLRPLDSREQQVRATLDSRRTEIVEVLAALQRAGRRTPPALLVRPEDALQSLRTAMLLGSVVPELRARAEKLAVDLGELVNVRKKIATQRDVLARDRDRLKDDSVRMAALVEERQRKQSAIEKDIEAEGRARHQPVQAGRSLQGLITKMEQDLKSAAKAAATASLQGAPAAPGGKPNLGALKDPARLSPAIAFASAKALFAFPVNGRKIRDFGGSDGAGGVEKGISLATKARGAGHNTV
jgi:septal ring factor EnvC (AmiA/AmiB activator)